jgi:cation diffusion facilitator CzcD-associated flavoprotein CzcO
MSGLDVLVVGPGNSGVDLLGHLARSDAGKLWLSARSGMNITPLRLGGVPLHPVSVLGRYLPLRWQDTNARAVQRLAFGDLSRLGYPRSALGAFTRAAADGVTVAVDDGFVRALKAGQVTVKPATGGRQDESADMASMAVAWRIAMPVRLGGVLVQATG